MTRVLSKGMENRTPGFLVETEDKNGQQNSYEKSSFSGEIKVEREGQNNIKRIQCKVCSHSCSLKHLTQGRGLPHKIYLEKMTSDPKG